MGDRAVLTIQVATLNPAGGGIGPLFKKRPHPFLPIYRVV